MFFPRGFPPVFVFARIHSTLQVQLTQLSLALASFEAFFMPHGGGGGGGCSCLGARGGRECSGGGGAVMVSPSGLSIGRAYGRNRPWQRNCVHMFTDCGDCGGSF